MSTAGEDETKPRCVIWQFTDGKPGHANQALGLIEALAIHASVDHHTIDVREDGGYFMQWLLRRFPLGRDLPAPDMLIGAGRRTHRPMLAARRVHRCPIVVMMKPQMPCRWFDHCIIPKHDSVPASDAVTLTDGAVNRIQPSEATLTGEGLFLIGGPSKHHGWDEGRLLSQISEIVGADSGMHWTLTTSRRTPSSTAQALVSQASDALTVVPFEQTGPQWVGEHLNTASTVWVSEDSVSMVYESLTAGAAVGLLTVPHLEGQRSRVIHGLNDLVQRGWVNTFDGWQSTGVLDTSPVQLNEAARCAEIIFERFLSRGPDASDT